MLDPASIERLAEFPEQNDPLLNVALAEEGDGGVLLSLARCERLGAEALDVIASEPALLERLAADPSRRVRRAVASNDRAGPVRARLAASDPAVEVRARAARASTDRVNGDREASARLSAALRAMSEGGVLA